MRVQGLRVKKYLEDHPRSSNLDITTGCGVGSPTKVISDLRAFGVNVCDMWKNGINRYGEECRYKVYWIEE